jgi:hypothetical protein
MDKKGTRHACKTHEYIVKIMLLGLLIPAPGRHRHEVLMQWLNHAVIAWLMVCDRILIYAYVFRSASLSTIGFILVKSCIAVAHRLAVRVCL